MLLFLIIVAGLARGSDTLHPCSEFIGLIRFSLGVSGLFRQCSAQSLARVPLRCRNIPFLLPSRPKPLAHVRSPPRARPRTHHPLPLPAPAPPPTPPPPP